MREHLAIDCEYSGAIREAFCAGCSSNSGETGETGEAALISNGFLCHTLPNTSVRQVWQRRQNLPFVSPCHTHRLGLVRQSFLNDFKSATRVSPVSPQNGTVIGTSQC